MSETQIEDPSEQGIEVSDTATEGADATPPTSNGTPEPSGEFSGLKAKAAAMRASKTKTPRAANAGATVPATPGNEAGDIQSGAVPADAGTPDGEITTQASNELAKLAARNGADPGVEFAGESTDTGGGESLYEKRQREIAAAKANRPGGKGKSAAKGKGKASPRAAAKKEKDAEKEKARKERAKLKADEKKTKDKEKAAARKKSEDERKAKLAKEKAERAAERASKAVPDLLKRENKALQAAFAEDYALAGPKTDHNLNGIGLRRAKADRGDFAAGYIMALRRVRRDLKSSGGQKAEAVA